MHIDFFFMAMTERPTSMRPRNRPFFSWEINHIVKDERASRTGFKQSYSIRALKKVFVVWGLDCFNTHISPSLGICKDAPFKQEISLLNKQNKKNFLAPLGLRCMYFNVITFNGKTMSSPYASLSLATSSFSTANLLAFQALEYFLSVPVSLQPLPSCPKE